MNKIFNMLISGGNEWNIMFLSNIKKLNFQIVSLLFYIVNLANQRNNMIIYQIKNYKVCIGDKKYNFTFHMFCV